MSKTKIFATTHAKDLVAKTCRLLTIKPGKALVSRHNDGEVRVEIEENVRDKDVFIVGPTNPPAENFDELIMLAEAARGSSARRVTIVPTYLGFNRQDRKDRPRVSMAARSAIKRVESTGTDRVLLLDLHSEATMCAFDVRTQVDHLYCSYAVLPYLYAKIYGRDFVVASPDAGGVARARAISRILGRRKIALFDKERLAPGEVDEGVEILGNVKGKDVLFIDDIIDTAGTICVEAKAAKKAGAKDIYVYAPHALFSKDAIAKLADSGIKEVVTTDTIYHEPGKLETVMGVTITCISISEFLASAIRRIHEGESLSELIPRPGFLEQLGIKK